MKLPRLAPIFSALILAACQGAPSPPPPQAAQTPKAAQGVDLPTDASDVLNALRDGRVEFVARYYREPDSRWPALSSSEAQRLSAQGLKIVAVWESHSADPGHFSYASGYGDALKAAWQATAIGQPTGTAIYFAVDYNAQWLQSVDEYFRGVAAGLAAAGGGKAEYAVGVYGSGAVCDAIKRTGLARYSWLSNSFAWDGSTGYEDWNIMQGGPSPELTFNHDSDEAREEYGAFQLAGGAAASFDGARPRDLGEPRFPSGGPQQTSALFPIP